MDEMGGTVAATSEPGRGSTFTLELPRVDLEDRPAPQAAEDGAFAKPSSDRLVLYVEDNPSNVALMEKMIERIEGVDLLVATDGLSALRILRNQRPTAVLLDLHLPDVDGAEVLTAIRTDPRSGDIPVAILSADASDQQRRRLIEQGASAYFTKPLNLQEIIDFIRS